MADAKKRRFRWRIVVRVCGWAFACVSTSMAARGVHRFVIHDPRFAFPPPGDDSADTREFMVQGIEYASRAKVAGAFAPDFGRSLLLMPVAERRRKLLAVDWVADASVSRIWPNRVLVRIWERKPVAFVNMVSESARARASKLALIDEQGVILDQPARSHFSFPILKGVNEQQTEAERRNRVRHMLRFLKDVSPHAKDISEVDISAMDNLKVMTQADGRVVELLLGNRNFGRRFQNFLDHYAEIRRRSSGVTTFDLRLDDRITAKE
jgi:cell division protein FtsQ